MAAYNPSTWPCYLDAALLVYFISYHRVIGLPYFKALGDCKLELPLASYLLKITLALAQHEAFMRLNTNELSLLQALAHGSSQPPILVNPSFAKRLPELLVFDIGSMVLFYHHYPG